MEAPADPTALTQTTQTSAVRWPWLIGGVLCVLGAMAMVALPFVLASRPEPLDRYGAVPPFELTNRFDETFSSQALDGKVWVAHFMFTRCPSICPITARQMKALQQALRTAGLRDDTALVSFSVDPERDTPQVLRDYAALHQAEPGFWNLLTGSRDRIWTLCRDGFALAVDESNNPAEPVTHSSKLVLIDHEGVIRGYYDGLTPAVVDTLAGDVERLVSQRP